jgi:hypothetical protein
MHMSRGRRTVWAATLAVTVITAWAVLRSADTDDGESEDRSTGSERRLTERTANTADRFAFAGPVQEPDEDSLSERWNEMTSSKRVDVLTARFHTAIDDLRSGLDVEQNLGGEDAWVRNQCVNDFKTPLQTATLASEVTTELDWLRFWWHFITSNDSSLGNKATFKQVVQLIAHTQKEFPWGNLSGQATDPHFFWPQLEAACADAPTFSCNLQRLQALMAKFGVYCEEDSLNPGECK